jgi:N-acetylglutamate synthase-like GNAT family acetyltransferase
MDIVYDNTLSVEDYCMLRESVRFYPILKSLVKKALDKSDFIVAAKADGVTVGMARLITDGTQVLIMDVVVRPNYQGKGIGKGLMNCIIHYIKTEYDQMLVNLLTDKMKTGFYEKFGFNKEIGMRLWYGI